jgi:hypothetical protein
MEEKFVIQALAALAQLHRLQIFRRLVVKGDEGLTPAMRRGIGYSRQYLVVPFKRVDVRGPDFTGKARPTSDLPCAIRSNQCGVGILDPELLSGSYLHG